MAKGAVITDSELTRQATAYKVNYLAVGPYTLHLFTNDHNPTPGDIVATYTELTQPGYAPQTIPAGAWNVLAPAAHAVLIEQTNPRRFIPGPTALPTKVYGYFVTDGAGNLAWAEAFTTPQDFTPGFFIDVRPKYRFANCAVP